MLMDTIDMLIRIDQYLVSSFPPPSEYLDCIYCSEPLLLQCCNIFLLILCEVYVDLPSSAAATTINATCLGTWAL